MKNLKNFVEGRNFPLLGILGTVIISLGCLISAIAFKGALGQTYAMENDFISELGGTYQSELAIVFNSSIIIGGAILSLFLGGLFFYFKTLIGKIGSILGIIAGIMGALVGFFPFNIDINTHGLVSMGFFYGGMITVILMTIGIFLEKDHSYPYTLKIMGIISGLIFIIFNFALGEEFADIFSESLDSVGVNKYVIVDDRTEGIWILALFEWLTLIGMLAWIFTLSMYLQKEANTIRKMRKD